MFKRFNERFGRLATVQDLDGLERAWKAVHDAVTSPGERKLYDGILSANAGKTSPYVAFTKKLEGAYHSLRKRFGGKSAPKGGSSRCYLLLKAADGI